MITVLPYVSIFAEADSLSEHIDEMLFGDECEIIDEKGDFWKIKTDYGYFGYIKRDGIDPKRFNPNYIVISPFADLLFQGKNYYKPFLSLPMGARVYVSEADAGQRYFKVLLQNGQEFFIHKNHIRPLCSRPKTETDIRKAVAESAKAYLDVQYRWGGRTPFGIDCSGLCFNAYRQNGINIWRDAKPEMTPDLREISYECARLGDLMFFKGHMAMYLCDGYIIHSSASRGNVAIEKYENNSYLKEIYISTGTLF